MPRTLDGRRVRVAGSAREHGCSGRFLALRAIEDVTEGQGTLNTGATAAGTVGEAFIIGKNVPSPAISSRGGSIGISASDAVTVAAGAGISTRAADSGDPFTGAASVNAAGDLVMVVCGYFRGIWSHLAGRQHRCR